MRRLGPAHVPSSVAVIAGTVVGRVGGEPPYLPGLTGKAAEGG